MAIIIAYTDFCPHEATVVQKISALLDADSTVAHSTDTIGAVEACIFATSIAAVAATFLVLSVAGCRFVVAAVAPVRWLPEPGSRLERRRGANCIRIA